MARAGLSTAGDRIQGENKPPGSKDTADYAAGSVQVPMALTGSQAVIP